MYDDVNPITDVANPKPHKRWWWLIIIISTIVFLIIFYNFIVPLFIVVIWSNSEQNHIKESYIHATQYAGTAFEASGENITNESFGKTITTMVTIDAPIAGDYQLSGRLLEPTDKTEAYRLISNYIAIESNGKTYVNPKLPVNDSTAVTTLPLPKGKASVAVSFRPIVETSGRLNGLLFNADGQYLVALTLEGIKIGSEGYSTYSKIPKQTVIKGDYIPSGQNEYGGEYKLTSSQYGGKFEHTNYAKRIEENPLFVNTALIRTQMYSREQLGTPLFDDTRGKRVLVATSNGEPTALIVGLFPNTWGDITSNSSSISSGKPMSVQCQRNGEFSSGFVEGRLSGFLNPVVSNFTIDGREATKVIGEPIATPSTPEGVEHLVFFSGIPSCEFTFYEFKSNSVTADQFNTVINSVKILVK